MARRAVSSAEVSMTMICPLTVLVRRCLLLCRVLMKVVLTGMNTSMKLGSPTLGSVAQWCLVRFAMRRCSDRCSVCSRCLCLLLLLVVM